MEVKKSTIWKILYGALFIVVLPILLIMWAKRMDSYIGFPVPDIPEISYLLLVAGCCLLFGGWVTLIIYGRGLPMNAFPPMQLVDRGVYHLMPHPIYTGFCVIVLSVSLLLQSPSGVWVVFPTMCLCCIALVFGYEKQSIEDRFGNIKIESILKLPNKKDAPATALDYFRVYALVLLPWLLSYEIVQYVEQSVNALTLNFSFEKNIPVIEWTEVIYISIYPAVLLFPVFIRKKDELRNFSQFVLISILVCTYIYVILTVAAVPREFEEKTFFGYLINLERRFDKPVCSFPSFHVIWAFICAKFFGKNKIFKIGLYLWAIAVSISCITTGAHTILDVVMGIIVFYLISERVTIWNTIREAAEEIADSWKEMYIGKLRLINHGLWAATGVFFGIIIVYTLMGVQNSSSIFITAICGVIGAALWAQLVEGSNVLLRPYGYYGGVLGIIFGAIISGLFYDNTFQILAAFAIAGPVIQSFGRFRCLIQGCCHGKPANEAIGIRYNNPHSRVTRLSDLGGKYIHPTPVYSILWNIVIFFILIKLYLIDSNVNVITGTYLVLTGLGRFVEEALRGEPQTKIIGGLRLYQWIAIKTIVAGGVFMSFPVNRFFGDIIFKPQIILFSLILGAIVYFALGADIPSSNKRFSRLT